MVILDFLLQIILDYYDTNVDSRIQVTIDLEKN